MGVEEAEVRLGTFPLTEKRFPKFFLPFLIYNW